MSINATDIVMHDLLSLCVDEGASDLHITEGLPPVLRLHGHLQPLDAQPLAAADTERLMKEITPDDHQRKLRDGGGSDFGLSFGDKGRFRVSIFMQKGTVGLVLRLIPSRLLTLDEIGLPPVVKELLFKPRGLFA